MDKSTWDIIFALSEELAALKGSEYKHMLITVYFAFRTLISKRAVQYLQMPPGSGKTWVGLLIAAYLKKINSDLTPIYVCLNDALVT